VIRDAEVYVEPSDCLMQILQEEMMLEDIMGILQDEYGYNEILECIDEADIAAYCIESELKFVCSLPMMQESLKYIPPQEITELLWSILEMDSDTLSKEVSLHILMPRMQEILQRRSEDVRS